MHIPVLCYIYETFYRIQTLILLSRLAKTEKRIKIAVLNKWCEIDKSKCITEKFTKIKYRQRIKYSERINLHMVSKIKDKL